MYKACVCAPLRMLDDVAAWWRGGARAHVVARVRVARRSGSVEEERAVLDAVRAKVLVGAEARDDLPPCRAQPALRQVVFRAPGTGCTYTLDFVARGSVTVPYPFTRRFCVSAADLCVMTPRRRKKAVTPRG